MQCTINVTLDVLFNEEDLSCIIQNQTVQVQTPDSMPLKMKRKLGVAEIRYGIFTLGSKSAIGKVLPRDTDITVIFKGDSYPGHTHKTSGGRIDRLSSLLKNFHVNSELTFEYDAFKRELYIS